MTTDIEFAGYDVDGDKVWHNTRTGRAVDADSAAEAEQWWNDGGGGVSLQSYIESWGPLTPGAPL